MSDCGNLVCYLFPKIGWCAVYGGIIYFNPRTNDCKEIVNDLNKGSGTALWMACQGVMASGLIIGIIFILIIVYIIILMCFLNKGISLGYYDAVKSSILGKCKPNRAILR